MLDIMRTRIVCQYRLIDTRSPHICRHEQRYTIRQSERWMELDTIKISIIQSFDKFLFGDIITEYVTKHREAKGKDKEREGKRGKKREKEN